ncbi:hypothetical protein TraAM80_08240 [Trypanosoma rangeli]|uniref:Clp1 P-loop domain-containing protein n=1 Tax=Trypanosoma rangeli TaxID=5698 RepID=A0A422N1N1_TRYRA|nr:uncharacterized protein TraAM80_08240 [Trypanosoma rangeli]RNE99353.1 hypothetical protein TraAM80_08240 [Trypanosoma rangeli]|eukprot:RNE99353.1 hypothetical protein TraAM80_08240 [Trypanosoma rangeli]
MASVYHRKITISAGEECTITGDGAVELQLLSGVVEVAGVLLPARGTSVFFLEPETRCVVLYTLEGGSVQATATVPFETVKTATGMAAVVQLCRRTLAAERRTKVLVIGQAHSGKTLTAHTICNLLREDAAGESTTAPAAAVFLMDLNPESNCVYAPGCVSTVQVEHALWPGTTSAPTLLPFSLFVGEASCPSAATMVSFMYFVEQLQECTETLLHAAAHHERVHLVIDAPAPVAGVKESVYFRRLIELVRPTHVVTVSARDGSETWSTFLQEDVQRVLPDCEFSYATPVVRRCAGSLREPRLREYFAGTPQFPLGCAKVVLPLAQLQFVQYATPGLASEAATTVAVVVSCRKVAATPALAGSICALSHAEVIEEVPLAPVAGLLLVVAVDEEHEELVTIVPVCEDVPRRFVIVPNAVTAAEPPTLSVTTMAPIEEAVAV